LDDSSVYLCEYLGTFLTECASHGSSSVEESLSVYGHAPKYWLRHTRNVKRNGNRNRLLGFYIWGTEPTWPQTGSKCQGLG